MHDQRNEQLPLLEYAISYASRGWRVLPVFPVDDYGVCTCAKRSRCASAGKHPLNRNGSTGATTDLDTIRDWWNKHPTANIGVATGRASNLVVLDVDPRNGGLETIYKVAPDLVAQMQDKSVDSPVCDTGGGGFHVFYRYPGFEASSRVLGPGLDFKSDGGYVVAAPSRHASLRLYEWSDKGEPTGNGSPPPRWLARLLGGEESAAASNGAAPPEAPPGLNAGDGLTERQVVELTEALNRISSDDRSVWIRVGMAIHSADPGTRGYRIWDTWAQLSHKYDAADSARVWGSFKNDRSNAVTLATVYGMAKATREPPVADGAASAAHISTVKVKRVSGASKKIPDYLLRPPGILSDIADYITSTAVRPQPVLAVNAAMSLAATVCGRHYDTETGLRTNLYLVGTGPTGCGKNHPRSAVKRILHAADLDDLIGGEELASGQAILTRVWMSPSVLFQLDEFGMLMEAVQNPNSGGHVAAIMSIFMKLFSSASDVYIGTEYADQDKRPRVVIEYPCVNIHATTTPETFYSAMRSKHILSGYLNRLLVIPTDLMRPEKATPGDTTVPRKILDWIRVARHPKGSGNLQAVNPAAPYTVSKTPEAGAMFDQFDAEIGNLMSDTRGTGMEALWNRAWEHADKLALVAAVATDPRDPRIDSACAKYAIDLVKWSVGRLTESVNLVVADSPFDAKVKAVYSVIAQSGERGLTLRDLGRVTCYRKLTPKERAEVLQVLIDGQDISLVEMGTTAAGGRSRTAYVALEHHD